jgi:pimeloyl-ACP methyl ester carboxylesterase
MLNLVFCCYLNILYKINSKKATKKIVDLFLKPPPAKKQKEFCSIFQSAIQFNLNCNGKNVSCYQWGKGGNGILLIHGWGGRAENFKKLILGFIQNGNTVYAFDAPAHGNSQGSYSSILEFKEIALTLIHQGKEIKSVIGYSLGGVASALALKDLERSLKTFKLILISAPSDLTVLFYSFINFYKLPNEAFIEGLQFLKVKMEQDLFKMSLMYMQPPVNAENITVILNREDSDRDLQNAKEIIRIWNIDTEHVLMANPNKKNGLLNDPVVIERIQWAVFFNDY